MARILRAKDPTEAKPSRPKILIFGAPGVGKTWGSLDFPNVYYIDTEGGANLGHYTAKLKASGGAYLGPDDGANDFDTVIEEVQSLATTKHNYKTLVIDSYSKMFNTRVSIDHERMEEKGRDMEKTFGAEKKGSINATRKMLRWFEKLDMNVILICHQKALWRDGKEIGQTYDGWDKLEYELHLALRIIKTGNSRNALVTKSRLQGFPDASTFPWSYAEFATRYGRDVIEKTTEPVKLASPEQVAQYQSLLQTLKVDPKLLEKWEDNCPDVTELDRESMTKRIEYLSGLTPKTASAAA